LYLMNPEINANCTNLLAAFYYCVEPYPPFTTVTTTALSPTGTNYTTISTFSYSFPAYTATTSYEILTTAGVPAPTNVAPGTRTAACGYYYDIEAGDTLASIANISDNAEADLISWNSELATALPAVGEAICVLFPTGNYTLIAATPPEDVSPFATTECADYYTVVENDSCDTIAAAQDISSAQFLALNPGLTCAGLLAGVAYCDFPLTPVAPAPPSNLAAGSFSNCTAYYTIASGNTCTSVDQQYDLALSDLLRWNPSLTASCTTIGLGEAYCVAGGGDACTDVYTVIPNDSCGSIETKFNITLDDIIAWNSFLTSSCALQVGQNLCVAGTPATAPSGPPANLAAGSLSNCTTYYTIASGDSCTSVDAKYDIALADLLRWNTALTSSCTTIQLSEAYCVAGGGDACTSIYTVASGDSCGTIETKFGITLADIIAWNPFLTSSCAIQIGQNLCVAGTPATGSSGPPANIAAGTLTNCTTYYTIASGDTCTSVDEKYDIALADLLRWNTALTSACTTIQLNEAYCVAGGGNACPEIYTVASGNSCGTIETQFGITLANILAWNPFLTSSCAIQVGENICVK
jgi:LysM repeat protein